MNIKINTAIRWMVYQDGKPLRGFATKKEAQNFATQDEKIVKLPQKTIQFEEAPF